MGHLVQLEQLGKLVQQAQQEQLVIKVPQGRLDPLEQLVIKVPQGRLVVQVNLGRPVQLEQQVTMARPVPPEQRVKMVQPVPQEELVMLVPQAQPVPPAI